MMMSIALFIKTVRPVLVLRLSNRASVSKSGLLALVALMEQVTLRYNYSLKENNYFSIRTSL